MNYSMNLSSLFFYLIFRNNFIQCPKTIIPMDNATKYTSILSHISHLYNHVIILKIKGEHNIRTIQNIWLCSDIFIFFQIFLILLVLVFKYLKTISCFSKNKFLNDKKKLRKSNFSSLMFIWFSNEKSEDTTLVALYLRLFLLGLLSFLVQLVHHHVFFFFIFLFLF